MTADQPSSPTGPDPVAVFGAGLLVGLALWLPSLGPTLRGDLDIVAAAARFLAAFALAWCGVAALARLWVRYQTSEPASTTAPPGTPRRRSDDPPDGQD